MALANFFITGMLTKKSPTTDYKCYILTWIYWKKVSPLLFFYHFLLRFIIALFLSSFFFLFSLSEFLYFCLPFNIGSCGLKGFCYCCCVTDKRAQLASCFLIEMQTFERNKIMNSANVDISTPSPNKAVWWQNWPVVSNDKTCNKSNKCKTN